MSNTVITQALCSAARRQWREAQSNARGMVCMFAHPLFPNGVCYMMNMDWINGDSSEAQRTREFDYWRLTKWSSHIPFDV